MPGAIRLYWKASAGYRHLYVIGALALLAVDLLDLLPPRFVGWLVDHVDGRLPGLTPLVIAAGFLGAMILQNIFRYPMRMYFMGTAARIVADIRARYASRLLRLSQEQMAREQIGDLMSRATNDMEAVQRALGPGLLLLVDTFYYLATIPVALVLISPELALYAFGMMPLIPLFALWMSGRISRAFGGVQQAFGELTSRARQNAAGMQVVRAYGADAPQIERFEDASNRFARRSLKLALLESLFLPGINLILGIGMVAVIYFGGPRAVAGEISIGDLVMFMQYLNMLVWPLMSLGWSVPMLQRGRASLLRIESVLATGPSVPDGTEVAAGTGIEFRGLTFRYPDSAQPALRDVTLRIEPGERVAILGPVGAGKTTLADVLTRLREPPPGTVFVGGIDVRNWRLAELRRRFAVAPQEPFIFRDTVEANIRAGGDGDPVQAMELAGLTAETFPHSLETDLGERGVNLSGGQRQRLSLARALARGAPVVILDDSLSAVDAETERLILDRLGRQNGKRTWILLSQRVRIASRADRVVVLDAGRIVETGTHEELMAKGGLYADLFRREEWRAALDGR